MLEIYTKIDQKSIQIDKIQTNHINKKYLHADNNNNKGQKGVALVLIIRVLV